uniref:Uncharacterized protein n=1 Tax=Seriola lalandi dorsalis TaxID=1841481 RepID=A0A3B4YFG3_SERLL
MHASYLGAHITALARSSASSSSCCTCSSYTHPGLELLHLLLASLHGDLFSFIQTVLQVFNGLLHVLLHTLQVSAGVLVIKLELRILLIPAASLGLKRTLQGLNGPMQVPLALFHLLIFFSDFTLHVCLHLVELQLGSQNLPLLMLKRTLR